MMLFGAYLLLFPFQLDFFGNFVSSLFAASGIHISWVVFSIALIVLSTTLAVLGIKPSLRTGLIGLAFEMAVLTVFSIVIIAKGARRSTLQAFNLHRAYEGNRGAADRGRLHDLAFVRFESATTHGDEARSRADDPRAVLLTT